jgi:hypothetical protein
MSIIRTSSTITTRFVRFCIVSSSTPITIVIAVPIAVMIAIPIAIMITVPVASTPRVIWAVMIWVSPSYRYSPIWIWVIANRPRPTIIPIPWVVPIIVIMIGWYIVWSAEFIYAACIRIIVKVVTVTIIVIIIYGVTIFWIVITFAFMVIIL